jgi:phosphoesterase RecJ-like protein
MPALPADQRGDVLAIHPEVAQHAQRVWELVREHQEITILTHKDADGDTLGCSLAMADAVERLHKRAHVICPPPAPTAYAFMPGYQRIHRPPLAGSQGRLVFIFDSANPERSGDSMSQVGSDPIVINIDHHVSNSRFGQVNIVVPGAAATGEILYDLFRAGNIPISPAAASNLYAAILFDTGGFRHDNTSQRVLAIGAELVGLGADPAGIARALFKSRKVSTLKLHALVLSGARFEHKDQIIWAEVTDRMLRETGATQQETEGIIDQLNSVQGGRFAILFKQIRPELTKISVRTHAEADANRLAEEFGGGGHRRAAGAEIPLPLKAAEERVLEAARRQLTTRQR